MNEDSLMKLKTMFNLKYIDSLIPSMLQSIDETGGSEYSFANLKLESSEWEKWKESHGIKFSSNDLEEKENYIEIKGITNKTLFVPVAFAEKALVLGFLP